VALVFFLANSGIGKCSISAGRNQRVDVFGGKVEPSTHFLRTIEATYEA
jgi:hypothetical protein